MLQHRTHKCHSSFEQGPKDVEDITCVAEVQCRAPRAPPSTLGTLGTPGPQRIHRAIEPRPDGEPWATSSCDHLDASGHGLRDFLSTLTGAVDSVDSSGLVITDSDKGNESQSQNNSNNSKKSSNSGRNQNNCHHHIAGDQFMMLLPVCELFFDYVPAGDRFQQYSAEAALGAGTAGKCFGKQRSSG